MELTTRCPACGTTFAASMEQLQLRKGYVRCVGCAHIFDGYEAVVPALAASAGPVQEPFLEGLAEPHGGAGSEPVFTEPVFTEPAFTAPPRAREPAFAVDAYEARARHADARDRGAHDVDVHEPGFRVSGAFPGAPDSGDADDDETVPVYGEARHTAVRPAVPEFLSGEIQPARRNVLARLAWLVLILAGLLLVAAQAAYVYRMQLALQWPGLRPVLESACQRLNLKTGLNLSCAVPYARSLKRLSITDSSLRRREAGGGQGAGGPQEMVFEAVLRNQLEAPQQWPVLWLELTDVSGAVLSRRYLPPDVYLAAGPGGPAIAAGSERRISVPLRVDAAHVSGYQVGLFFP